MYINAKGCCRQRSDNGQVETAGAMLLGWRGKGAMQSNGAKFTKTAQTHTARKDTCGTCSNSNGNLQRTRKSLPGGSQAVQAAPCGRVPCVDFSLLRPSTVASSKPTAAAAAGRRQDEEEEEELAVTLPTVSTAAAATPRLLLHPFSACCFPPAVAVLLLSCSHPGNGTPVLPRSFCRVNCPSMRARGATRRNGAATAPNSSS